MCAQARSVYVDNQRDVQRCLRFKLVSGRYCAATEREPAALHPINKLHPRFISLNAESSALAYALTSFHFVCLDRQRIPLEIAIRWYNVHSHLIVGYKLSYFDGALIYVWHRKYSYVLDTLYLYSINTSGISKEEN